MSDNKPKLMLTIGGVMDCSPRNKSELYISSCGSKRKPVYDRTLAGKQPKQ